MVATLPLGVALREIERERLAILDLPYDPLRVKIEAVWHQRFDRDAGVQWLAGQMLQAGDNPLDVSLEW